jgi:hypothetical protein
MSWVTNAILYFGHLHGDEETRALEQVNVFFSLVQVHGSFLGENVSGPVYVHPAPRGFVSVKDAALPRHWYGGSKGLECSLAIGAFNGLDIDALVEYLCNLCASKVLDPLAAQLILMDQEEDRFHVINIDEEMRARGMNVPKFEPWSEGEGGTD